MKTSILFPPPCKINNARHRHIGKQKMISRLILSNSSRRIPRLVSRCLSVDVKDFANGPDYLKAELDSNCQEPDWQKISQNLIGKFRSSSEYSRHQERLYPKHIDHFIVIFARDYDIVILLKFVQFLKRQNRKITIPTYDAILKALTCLDKPQDLNDDLRNLVYEICDDVKKLPRLPVDVKNCLNVTLAKFGKLGEKQTVEVLTNAGTSGIKSLCLKVIAENKPLEALKLMKTDAFQGDSYLYRYDIKNQLRDDVYIQFIKKYGHNLSSHKHLLGYITAFLSWSSKCLDFNGQRPCQCVDTYKEKRWR